MEKITKNISKDGMVGTVTIDHGKAEMNLILPQSISITDVIKLKIVTKDGDSVNCGTAQMQGNSFILTASDERLSPENTAMAEIIRKNVYTEDFEIISKISFNEDGGDIEANISDAYRKLTYLREHPAYKAYMNLSGELKSPVENAAEALKNLQNALSGNRENNRETYIASLIKGISKYDTAPFSMPKSFKWYKITDVTQYFNISSIAHILASEDTKCAINKHGYYLLGWNPEEYKICIAVPFSPGTANPVSHAEDCTVYIPSEKDNMEFCTVCVSFEKDGQYFTPLG